LRAGADEPPPRRVSFAIIDQSDTGFGLFAPMDERAALDHRELVAVRLSAAKEWQIGMIARTTVLPAGKGRLVGVHLLARTAILVSLAKMPPVSEPEPGRLAIVYGDPLPEPPAGRAFFLVGDAAKNQADSLLAPPGVYAPGDRLKLKTASNGFIIRVNRVIQSGEGWQRTGFQVVQKFTAKSI
jgi:hypothetical protein